MKLPVIFSGSVSITLTAKQDWSENYLTSTTNIKSLYLTVLKPSNEQNIFICCYTVYGPNYNCKVTCSSKPAISV